jgi:hypothetical protein
MIFATEAQRKEESEIRLEMLIDFLSDSVLPVPLWLIN